ncbi:MAG: beta strand repeat-containing protein, partial [Allosphingosinicella sp.]
MKRTILTSVSVAALLAAAPAIGQNNTSEVDQSGTSQDAFVTQSGSGAESLVEQTGTDNLANVAQSGSGNSSEVTQNGVYQNGIPTPTAGPDGVSNRATVTQSGDDN